MTDIKLENIMATAGSKPTVSLIDFGLCHHFKGSDVCSDFAGSREYAAPELLLSKMNFSATQVDVWALGVTIFALLYGVFPFSFDADEQAEIERTGIHPRPHFPANVTRISTEAMDLLSKMMESDPTKRISMREVKNHPFLKSKSLFRRSLSL